MSEILQAEGEKIEIVVWGKSGGTGPDFISRIFRNGTCLPMVFSGKTRDAAKAQATDFWIAEVEKIHGSQLARAERIKVAQARKAEADKAKARSKDILPALAEEAK